MRTIYVLAPINLKVQFIGCSQKFLKKTFVHRYSFIVAITSIRPKVLIPSCISAGTTTTSLQPRSLALRASGNHLSGLDSMSTIDKECRERL